MEKRPDEKKLKDMGIADVIADLEKKFPKQNIKEKLTPGPTLPGGFDEILKNLVANKDAFLKRLELSQKEVFSVDDTELPKIRKIQQLLTTFQNERTANQNQHEVLNELESLLDRVTLWGAKFATENSGGAGAHIPLQSYNRQTDSLYYVTPSGVSLRLKTINIEKGIAEVIQPFAEKIIFVGPNHESSEVPKEGYNVEEYLSGSFSRAVNKGDAYTPSLEVYRESGSIIAIASDYDERIRRRSVSPAHEGDRVNKIFFSK